MAETVCADCGGANVEVAVWLDPNTGKVGDPFGSPDADDTTWCHDCDAHVALVEAAATRAPGSP